jgi:TolA-binding protein
MSDDRRLPELPVAALRDHGDSERVERVWRRLEQDIPAASARPRSALWWAPAAVVIVFGCGVFVGARWFRAAVPSRPTTVAAEPAEPLDQQQPSTTEVPGAAQPGAPAAKPEKHHGHERRVAPASVPALEEAPAEAPAPAPAASAAPPAWQRLANAGDFAAAHQALEDHGGFDSAMGAASAEQLMSLFDIARFAGHRDRALQALRRVVSRFPNDPNAPLAAWTLGNMLDKAGDRAGAADAFRVYRRLSPQGDFAEDALAREVEVAIEQGNLDQAKKLADQYAKDFPKGRRLGEIRDQLARASSAADAGAAVVEGDAGAPGKGADKPEGNDPPAAAPVPAH